MDREKQLAAWREKSKIFREKYPEKVRESKRAHREKYPDRIKVQRRKWTHKNKERIKELRNKYYIEVLTPIRLKKLGLEHLSGLSLDDIMAEKKRLTKIRQEQKKKDDKAKCKKYVLDYKNSHPCKCGEDHPACLVFHHKDPNDKFKDIPQLVGKGNFKRLKSEIEKCELMCGNCHAVLHWKKEQDKKNGNDT
tara:strand:+ start:61 stop:639 length:579 start_codon:yes stop_codon:yes gene_type:complete